MEATLHTFGIDEFLEFVEIALILLHDYPLTDGMVVARNIIM